jgi:hypothetical protein
MAPNVDQGCEGLTEMKSGLAFNLVCRDVLHVYRPPEQEQRHPQDACGCVQR